MHCHSDTRPNQVLFKKLLQHDLDSHSIDDESHTTQ